MRFKIHCLQDGQRQERESDPTKEKKRDGKEGGREGEATLWKVRKLPR